MYSVLLVDDESLELETMEHYVPWEQVGIRVAGTARNGKEALGKLKELKPDIIVTDVRMPIMDGLEFGRRAKQIDKSVKIIYLSGHNEFQYIKSALQIEAAGYVLKPIDMEELLTLLEKVKRKCEEEQLANAGGGWVLEKLLLRIVRETNAETRMEWIRQWESRAGGFTAGQPFGAAYWTFEQPAFGSGSDVADAVSVGDVAAVAAEELRSLLKRGPNVSIVLEIGPNALFVLFQRGGQQDDPSYWELMRAELLGSLGLGLDATVGLSGPHHSFRLLKEAYEEARRCNDEKLYRQSGATIVPSMIGPVAAAADLGADAAAAALIAAIQAGEAEEAQRCLADWFAWLRQRRFERGSVIRGVIQLLTLLEQHFASLLAEPSRIHLLADHWRQLSQLPTIAHFHEYAQRFSEELLKAVGEREQDRNGAIAMQIARLLEERYHLPITVEDIAKDVYLSPNYVRTIFKEKTGETILDYLTRIRMNHASELLKDRALKVREIAHRVGYENVSYFCSVFHKHKGSTPNEYRKMHL